MNEYSVLMRLITRSGDPIGAGIEDMLDALGLPEDVGRGVLFQRLAELDEILQPLGMTVRHNPIGHVFYLDTKETGSSEEGESKLPDRLAATLLVVMTLAYQEGGWVPVGRVKEYRKKTTRSVQEDLRELSRQGYVELDGSKKKVRPGLRVAFELDYEGFFERLSQEPDRTQTE